MATGNSTPSSKPISPKLFVKEIQDLYIRKNFENLQAYFAANNQLQGFNFFELNVTSTANGNVTLTHGLGYVPKDIIITQTTGSGIIKFLYGAFTNTTISYTAIAPIRVRFFVGTYPGDTSTVQSQSTDQQNVQGTL